MKTTNDFEDRKNFTCAHCAQNKISEWNVDAQAEALCDECFDEINDNDE